MSWEEGVGGSEITPMLLARATAPARRPNPSLGAALGVLGAALRHQVLGSGDRRGPMATLASGHPTPAREIRDAVGGWALEALVGCGLLVADGGDMRLTMSLCAVGQDLCVALDPERSDDLAYCGPDTLLLLHLALRLGVRGNRAADLGSGTGLLAAVLSRRFRVTISTDLSRRALLATRLTLALNPPPPGHVRAVALADVAGGLRPGTFDLVTANTPWVPSPPDPKRRRLYADGGPTGTELPLRFLRSAAALLRPGGLAAVLALDVTLSDGRRPLAAAWGALEEEGHTVVTLRTPINHVFGHHVAAVPARHPTIAEATHVAVVVARPHRGGGRRDAVVVAANALLDRWSRASAG